MRPMLATPGPLPVGSEWAYEVKFDGIRLMSALREGQLHLTSRNGKDLTSAFPELRELARALINQGIRTAALDGELVARGTTPPTLQAIAPRIHRSDAGPDLVAAHPVTYVLFDIVELDGTDLARAAFRERSAALSRLVEDTPGWIRSQIFTDGAALWEATRAQSLEGVVAKRWSSTYQAGVRSRDWIKSVHRTSTDVVIIGWREESGSRDRVGSLIVAEVRDGELRYTGSVGAGLTQAHSDALLGVLPGMALDRAPIPVPGKDSRANWVEPALVVCVRHLGRTADRRLRQPVVVGLRPDLTAHELLMEVGG